MLILGLILPVIAFILLFLINSGVGSVLKVLMEINEQLYEMRREKRQN
jgi:hypothetical protein